MGRGTKGWTYVKTVFDEETLASHLASDGLPIIRTPVQQSGENCFQHHLGRSADCRYRKKCTDAGKEIEYKILDPKKEGSFAGDVYFDAKGVERCYPEKIFGASIDEGLPTTSVDGRRHKIISYRKFDPKKLVVMKNELFGKGALIITITPKDTFPVKEKNRMYVGEGNKMEENVDHAQTVIGFGDVKKKYVKCGVDGVIEEKFVTVNSYWVAENSWHDNEEYNRIRVDQVENAYCVYV